MATAVKACNRCERGELSNNIGALAGRAPDDERFGDKRIACFLRIDFSHVRSMDAVRADCDKAHC
eukprot:SAG11_NODE_50_length_19992_cov_9.945157_5_plen_65_part_00